MAQSFAYSDLNLKSKEDWLAFVDEVDKHLKRYAIGGIFPEQYEGVLQPHLTLMIWTHIFEDHVPRAPNLISRPEEWRPVLDLYSLKYYNCEVKIRSNNKFLHDTAEYSQSAPPSERDSPYSTQKGSTQTTLISLLLPTTDKHAKAFLTWDAWKRSRPLQYLLNSTWKNSPAIRTFQPFGFPSNSKALTISSLENGFRTKHWFCARCSNHVFGDGKQYKLHSLYKDIKISDSAIVGKGIS